MANPDDTNVLDGQERSHGAINERRVQAHSSQRPSVRVKISDTIRYDTGSQSPESKKTVFLSIGRTSTFAFIASILYVYSWALSIGLVSTGITGGLILSSQESLSSYKQDQQIFQTALEEIKMGTQLAKEGLRLSASTCRVDEDVFLFEDLTR